MLYVAGPGHGGPAVVANVYLEGTYSEVYPEVSADEAGLLRLVRQFSTPGGIPSHVSVPTPGSIHEGGELGYALVHAFGAAFDNPDLLVACVIGDGEAETAPLEGSWKGVRFLNPARDGAVLPILHLNEIQDLRPDRARAGARRSDRARLLGGHGYEAHFVAGSDPRRVHREFAADARRVPREDRRDPGRGARRAAPPAGRAGRRSCCARRRAGPGRRRSTASQVEGTFRAHQVPLGGVRENPAHLAHAGAVDARLPPRGALRRRGPAGRRAGGAGPGRREADGRRRATPTAAAAWSPLEIPDPARLRARGAAARAASRAESTRRLGELLRDVYSANAGAANFRLFCPDETNSNRLGAVFEVEDRCLMDAAPGRRARLAPTGRVMEVLSEHNCQGWLEGYLLSGRHGLFATYEAFAMVSASMAIQHTKWLEEGRRLRVAGAGRLAQRAAHLDLLAQRPQRLQPPGPGADRHDDLACAARSSASTSRPTPTAC